MLVCASESLELGGQFIERRGPALCYRSLRISRKILTMVVFFFFFFTARVQKERPRPLTSRTDRAGNCSIMDHGAERVWCVLLVDLGILEGAVVPTMLLWPKKEANLNPFASGPIPRYRAIQPGRSNYSSCICAFFSSYRPFGTRWQGRGGDMIQVDWTGTSYSPSLGVCFQR